MVLFREMGTIICRYLRSREDNVFSGCDVPYSILFWNFCPLISESEDFVWNELQIRKMIGNENNASPGKVPRMESMQRMKGISIRRFLTSSKDE